MFIDTIEEVSEDRVSTRFTVPETCMLVTDGILPLAGLMENAAQTCAVRAGTRIGYIGAIKQMEVNRFPHVGETIRTTAVLVQEVLNISLMQCTARVNEEVVATTVLKVAVME